MDCTNVTCILYHGDFSLKKWLQSRSKKEKSELSLTGQSVSEEDLIKLMQNCRAF